MPAVSPAAAAAPAGTGARLVRYWLPVAAYVVLIFSLSSLHSGGPSLFPNMDKLEHLGEYGLFGLLLGRAFRFTVGGRRGLWWAVGTVLVGSAVGAMDEFYQAFVPGRTSDVRDWLTDSLALLLAVLFTQLVSVHPLRGRPGEGGSPAGVDQAKEGRP